MDNITLITASALFTAFIAIVRCSPTISATSFFKSIEFRKDVRKQMDKTPSSHASFVTGQNRLAKEVHKQICIHNIERILELPKEVKIRNLSNINEFCDLMIYLKQNNANYKLVERVVHSILQTYTPLSNGSLSFTMISNYLKESPKPDFGRKNNFISGILKHMTNNSTPPTLRHRHLSHFENITSQQETAETNNYISNRHHHSQINNSSERSNTTTSHVKRASEQPFRTLGESPLLCRHRVETKLVMLPGCIPKSVLTTRCQGSCHSRSMPEWDDSTQNLRYQEHCTCCAPNSMRVLEVRFRCPGRERGHLIKRIAYPFQCSCRPCAVAANV